MKQVCHPLFIILVAGLLSFGCGGGDGESSSSADTDASEQAQVATGPMGTASVGGTINFAGTPPAQSEINLDRECAALHDGSVMTENVVVNDNGSLKNVFIHVTEGLGGATYSAPSEPVVFDQSGCMYQPHVFGVQVGQTIKILNSDPLLHNIHALPEINRPFNFGMPRQGDERDRSFRAEEVMVKIKCDVHPWMGAWAGVVSHPFYDVSGDDGSFSIDKLPAGTYTVEAWHEEYGTTSQTVTVGDGESATLDFTFGG